MVKKLLLLSSVLFGLLFLVIPGECFADVSTQLKQADAYKKNKQYGQAEAIYQQVAADYPSTEDAFQAQKNLAMLYVLWGKQPQADTAFQNLLTNFSQHRDIVDAVNGVAYQYVTVKNHAKAIELYQYVLDNWPDDDRAIWSQTSLVALNIALENYPTAQAATDRLLTEFSGNENIAEAVYRAADKYRKSKKYEEARNLYQHTVDNWPQDEYAMWSQMGLAKVYVESGNMKAAQAAVDELTSKFARQEGIAKAIYEIAEQCNWAKRYKKAAELYRVTAENWPQAEHGLWSQTNLALVQLKLGWQDAAEYTIDKLLTDFAGHKFAKNQRVAYSVYKVAEEARKLGEHKYTKAHDYYQYVVENWPDDERAMWAQTNLVKIELELGRVEATEAAKSKLLTEFAGHKNIEQAVHNLADEYEKKGEREKANQLYQHIVRVWPDSEHALWAQKNLTISLIQQGQTQAAQAAIEKLLTDFSGHKGIEQAVHIVASHCRKSGKYGMANQLDQHVVDNWPESEHALWAQMDIVLSNVQFGNYPAAYVAADKLLTDFAGHKSIAQAVHNVASNWRKSQKYIVKANQLDQFVVDNCPESEHALWALRDLAMSNIELGNDADTQAAIDRLLTEFSERKYIEQAVHSIASQCRKSGKYELANQLYQHVVDNWPRTEQAMWAQMNLALLNIELGNDPNAQAATNTLLTDFAGQERIAQAVHDIAVQCRKSEKHEMANQLYQHIVDNWPDSEHAMWAQKNLALLNLELGETEAAQAAVDKLLSDFAGHERIAQAIHDIASQYRQSGKYEMPDQLCQYIVENWPESEHALWAQINLVESNIERGDDPNAQAAIDKLLTQFSKHERISQAVRSVASRYRELGQHEKADQLCHYIVEHWAESEHGMWAKRDLSMWNIESGKTTFQAELDGLVADFNDHPTLPGALFSFGEKYYNKAFRCENEGRASEAKENFRKAITAWERIITDLPFSDFTPQAYYLSALCYRRLGEYEVAIEHCRIIVDNWSGYRRAWHAQFMIGRCYEELERQGGIPPSEATPKIREAYEKLLESYPDCKVAAIAKKWLNRTDND